MKSLVKILAIPLILAFMISGCLTMEKGYDPTEELNYRWQQFARAWNALDAEACALFYAEDGVNIPPDLSIRTGRDDIADFYGWLFSMHNAAEYHHEIVSVSYGVNMAVEQGEFRVNWTRNDNSEWQFVARSLTHWHRVSDGEWEIKSFIFNAPPS